MDSDIHNTRTTSSELFLFLPATISLIVVDSPTNPIHILFLPTLFFHHPGNSQAILARQNVWSYEKSLLF